MAIRIRGQTGTSGTTTGAPGVPVVTYTPDGVPRQPGYFNDSNPYDTGRPGEQNKERNQGRGGKLNGWNYDTGQPMPGTTLGENGMYVLGGGGGGGAGSGGLGNNPMFDRMSSLFQSQSIADAASRREAIQKALIAFGLVPENFQDKYGDITDLTKGLAQKNTSSGISTYARLLESRKDSLMALINRLTARGLRRSGAKGAGMRKAQLGFDRNYADSLQSLLSYIQNAYSGFSNAEYQRALALMQAQMDYFNYFGGTGGVTGPSGPAAPSYAQTVLSNLGDKYLKPNPETGLYPGRPGNTAIPVLPPAPVPYWGGNAGLAPIINQISGTTRTPGVPTTSIVPKPRISGFQEF